MSFLTQVGRPYDARVIERDLRQLWRLDRFEDIRVETLHEADGTAVIFAVVEGAPMRLHKLSIEPPTAGLEVTLPEGTPLNRRRAHEIANEARKQLNARGYINARVDSQLVPVTESKVDLRLTVSANNAVRVRQVEFSGDLGLDPSELRNTLRALRIRRVFPGMLSRPPYSPEAVDSDVARLRSRYLSKGYFDAVVRVNDAGIGRKGARVNFLVHSGPRYRIRRNSLGAADFCSCLLAARRDAERLGILDFSARLNVEPVDNAVADLTAKIHRGRPYRVGRIDFSGNRHYTDAMLRRNFVLDEGALLDQRLLRHSTARLNHPASVAILRNERTGLADIAVRLSERKRGAWALSGPVGPANIAGPLKASLSLRVADYLASFSLLAFAHPILPFLSAGSRTIAPVLSLARPFSPGEGWKSGFTIAPQLGWQASALSYATTQLQHRLLPLLSGTRSQVPELPVTVERPAGDVTMFCQPPKPRFMPLRNTVALGLQLLGAE